MLRLSLIIVLATTPSLAQTTTPPSHTPPLRKSDDRWLDQVAILQNRARQILKAELSREIDPKCDPGKLSNADFGNCFAADEASTERNYRAFAQILEASLAIKQPDVDAKIFPAAKHFAAGEIAWRTYVDKTCAALGDTYDGGSGAPSAMTGCQQQLTQQHMKDLNEIFLKQFEVAK